MTSLTLVRRIDARPSIVFDALITPAKSSRAAYAAKNAKEHIA
jgi:hypothetical protein